jgi:hypothetical protein
LIQKYSNNVPETKIDRPVMLKIVLFFSIWFLWMEAGCLRLFNKVLVLNINISCCNEL